MRIQHNISAMNAYRNYSNNNSALSKNLEKLSSGYKINRAGDDAAGLAISEKMRAQIAGLDQAQSNAKSGVNLVQTAEGALTEVHDMLNRMVTLADQSANGTYDSETDRPNLQKEVQQLKDEIDRISKSSNFNGIKLLDGSLEKGKASGGGSVTVDISKLTGNLLSGVNTIDATKGQYYVASPAADKTTTAASLGDKYEYTFEYTDNDGVHQKKTFTFEVALADGQTDATKQDALVLKASDGTTYAASATANKIAKGEITDALISEMAKDADFSSNFKVLEDGTTADQFNFSAVNAGANGAELLGVTETVTTAADGKVTNTSGTVKVGDPAVTANVGVSTAVDSFKTVDLKNAKVWEGDTSKLEDAIFEINGEKFLFIKNGLTIDDKMKSTLSDAGVGNNYVQIASSTATTTVDNADVTNMVDKIGAATGLKVEQGTATIGTTNTWAKNTTGTEISLRDSETVAGKESGGLTLQIGDTSDDFNQLNISIQKMDCDSLGLSKVDISEQGDAQSAVDVIKKAINTVSSVRGDLGAAQNRLEHTMNNLSVMSENITDAESNIRDTDVAAEMMKYTKNNILIQSAQAMLAQANQSPQGVLQLLQ